MIKRQLTLNEKDTEQLIDDFLESLTTNEHISSVTLDDFDTMQVFLDNDPTLLNGYEVQPLDAEDSCPAHIDDRSDASTDIASDISTPPTSYNDDAIVASPVLATGNTSRCATTIAPIALPIATMLPIAFPLPPYPLFNPKQKRPLPDVHPNAEVTNMNLCGAKKTRREVRQMKNRESANRSRLRRKEQLSYLSAEVETLTTKQHELENIIAALRAENQSLHDQNNFLRSLVTMCSDPNVRLTDTCKSSTLIPTSLVSTSPKQSNSVFRSVTAMSAMSVGLCASMFGLTIMTNIDGDSAQTNNIRRVGRVLHSFSTSQTKEGSATFESSRFTLEPSLFDWNGVSSRQWSEILCGLLVNIITFAVFHTLHQAYIRYSNKRLYNECTRSSDGLKFHVAAPRQYVKGLSSSPNLFERHSENCYGVLYDSSQPGCIHLQSPMRYMNA